MPAQLVSLIHAESLVNDGSAVVLFSLVLATGTGEPASAPGVFVDHLRPKCWCQQRGALSQTGSGRRSSNSRPLPWQGRLLILNSDEVEIGLQATTHPQFPRGSTLTTRASTLVINECRRRGRG
jgi:hypothetical protein